MTKAQAEEFTALYKRKNSLEMKQHNLLGRLISDDISAEDYHSKIRDLQHQHQIVIKRLKELRSR